MSTALSFQPRTFVHKTDRGELRLSVPAPTVFLFEYRGFTDENFIKFVDKVWDEEFGGADFMVQVFADTAGQTGFNPSFRTGMMKWNAKIVGRTDEYVLLVKSRWIAMGIAIVRSTVGLPNNHVEVSTKRELFQAKLDAAVKRSIEDTGVVRSK